MKRALDLGVLGVVACISAGAFAAGHEKPYSLIGCGITEVTVVDKAGDMTLGANRARGTTQSVPAGNAFDNMAYECRSTWNASKAGLQFSGRCTFVDLDGDKLVGSFAKTDAAAQGWTWTILGGSGKWSGATGGGTTQAARKMPKLRPGENSSCWKGDGTYTLPK